VSLLFQVAAYLRDRNIPSALIGGDALAVHGVPRATLDQDLLAVDARVLDAATWTGLMEPSLDIDIRKGDADDPLPRRRTHHEPKVEADVSVLPRRCIDLWKQLSHL
jgi:hypothetical protein